MDSGRKEAVFKPSQKVREVIEAATELPLLDLGAFLSGDKEAENQLVADIAYIQETLGFYAITNHGLEPTLIDRVVEQTKKLFMLPDEEKLRCRSGRHMQGYWPPNSVANYRPGFEKEKDKKSTIAGWVFSRDRTANDPKVVGGAPHRAMNNWPEPALVPDFRPVMEEYQSAMLSLAMKLVPIYAQALGLEPDYFAKDFKVPEWYVRCNYHSGGAKGMFANAHSDHSFLTLLPIARVPGLQVRTPAETWIDVKYIEGAIVVNTGEWLSRLSNGRFIATPHQVTNPVEERISVPFFMNQSDEATDDPVPGALKPGEKRKFEPMTFGDFYADYIDTLTLAKTMPKSS